MTLNQLLYTSRNRPESYIVDLGAILNVSRKNNPNLGITGFLIATETHYIQFIEGPAENVAQLFYFILVDERHSDIRLVFERVGERRYFPSWTMHSLAASETQNRLAQSLGCMDLQPDGLSIGQFETLVRQMEQQPVH
jgi:hypothetical protein